MTTTKARRSRATNQPTLTHTHSSVVAQWPAEALHQEDDWCVYPDESLDRWEVFVDTERQRTFVHQDTWDTIAWDPRSQNLFFQMFVHDYLVGAPAARGWEEQMRFIVADTAPWRDAVRKEATAAGTHVPAKKDRLQELSEKATALILQAASLNATATQGQAQTFGVRYAQMAADLAVLEQELARARGLIELAATAVVDASA